MMFSFCCVYPTAPNEEKLWVLRADFLAEIHLCSPPEVSKVKNTSIQVFLINLAVPPFTRNHFSSMNLLTPKFLPLQIWIMTSTFHQAGGSTTYADTILLGLGVGSPGDWLQYGFSDDSDTILNKLERVSIFNGSTF